MRLPLTTTGLPFSGDRIIQDLRSLDEEDRETPRYVTLFALNTRTDEPNPLALGLLSDDEHELFTLSLPPFEPASKVVRVLERFPLMGASALHVNAGDEVLCFGFVEIEPVDRPALPTPFMPGDTFTEPASERRLALGTEQTIHSLSDTEIHDVSLVLDANGFYADAGVIPTLEVLFDNLDGETTSFTFAGALQSFSIFKNIPMRGPGAIRVRLDPDSEVIWHAYGTFVRR
jgi:hypothetical protein